MKKIHSIITTTTILILIIHVTYVLLGFFHVIEVNEILSTALGHFLIILVFFHGLYGFCKWFKPCFARIKARQHKQKRYIRISLVTWLQRFTGLYVLLFLIPHTMIDFEASPQLLMTFDDIFILCILIHLIISIPRLFISLGLVKAERRR